MQFNIIIAAIYAISFIYALFSGRVSELTTAAFEGASGAVTLCFNMCGMICLWSACLELMSRSGLSAKLSRLLRPLLGRLYPRASRDPETMEALCANVSANFLGLGNAATPAGIKAAQGMQRISGKSSAGNELCMFVVMNTASIQLLPTTAAALRASYGSQTPFDILPAVWLSSLLSVSAGLIAAKIFERFSRRGRLG
ncbi:MAG: spore maturation protein A [Oscillospiraceae bacterium]|nr:spore maturation protein A [Oscillospiraceae bacterium]